MKNSHGMSGTRIYLVWCAMRNRCERPEVKSYPRYGGRGIKVCKRWQKFENFFADMGEPPQGMSIERKKNDRDYGPGNCVWATKAQQSRNKRNNVMITAEGKTQCLTDWAREKGVSHAAIVYRLRVGWTPEHAVTYPFAERPNAKLTMADAEAIRSGFGEFSAKELAHMYDITDVQIYNVINFKVFKP